MLSPRTCAARTRAVHGLARPIARRGGAQRRARLAPLRAAAAAGAKSRRPSVGRQRSAAAGWNRGACRSPVVARRRGGEQESLDSILPPPPLRHGRASLVASSADAISRARTRAFTDHRRSRTAVRSRRGEAAAHRDLVERRLDERVLRPVAELGGDVAASRRRALFGGTGGRKGEMCGGMLLKHSTRGKTFHPGGGGC